MPRFNLLTYIDKHYRRYHDLLFYLVTMVVIVIATYAAITITKQKNEQEMLNMHEKEIIVTDYTIRQKPIYIALQDTGLPSREVFDIVSKLSSVVDTRKLQNQDNYSISTSEEGTFNMLILTQGFKRYYVASVEEGLVAGVSDIEIKTRIKNTAGKITGSLFNSMLKDGITVPLVVDLTDAFSWNIDFNTETRNGDVFAAIWEENYTVDGTITSQELVSALYKGEATGTNYAFYFNDEFYDETGKISKKMFLKSPISFRGYRISSRFSNNRLHPILRIRRPHLGIDYAAPTGTPVEAVADGTIRFAGWKGGFGNLIEVKHANNYITMYGHLKGFAKNIKVGTKVKQGAVIGYVGSTGLSTGPHLDFRIKERNKFIDFLKMKNRNSAIRSIPAEQMEEFQELKELYLKELNQALVENEQTPILVPAEEKP